jgi:hypothetical protein
VLGTRIGVAAPQLGEYSPAVLIVP